MKPIVDSTLHQAVRFLGVSGTGWLLDSVVLAVLVHIGVPVFVAGLLSALTGAFVAFSASPNVVFRTTMKRFPLKLAVYLTYTLVLAILIAGAIAVLTKFAMAAFAGSASVTLIALTAKILITPFTLLANYCVARYLIVAVG